MSRVRVASAILSRQVNEHLEYFQKLADKTTYTDLVHDAPLGEAAWQTRNAMQKLADLLTERVQCGYEFETPPKPV